jgi:hypothetical protein
MHPTRIEYTNTFLDVVLFQAVHQFLSPAAQGFYGICFALFFWTEALERPAPEAAAGALCIWGLLWLVQFLFNAVYFASRSNRTILTSHVAEVRDDGFYEETRFSRSLFFWPGVAKAVSRPGFLAVYVSGQHAHVIPKRAFASKSEMESFRTHIAEGIRRSNGLA